MNRTFKIEYPDDCGEMWMNVDNLMLCINAYCKGVDISAEDVTALNTKIDAANAIMAPYCLDGKPWVESLCDTLLGEENNNG